MKIQQFTGGLSTRQRPQFLQTAEAVAYTNIDSRVGSLAPVAANAITDIEATKYNYYYAAETTWVSRDEPTDFLEYNKRLYMTDRVTAPKVLDGATETNLGIAPPAKLTSFAYAEHPSSVAAITTAVAAGSGMPVANNYYVLVNSNDAKYSLAMELLVDEAGAATILNPAASSVGTPVVLNTASGTRTITIKNPTGITLGNQGVKVYRLYDGEYYLVGSLLTSTASLVDSVEDISANEVLDQGRIGVLSGTVQYAMTFYSSSTGVESALSPQSGELELTNGGQVVLSNLELSTDPAVDKKRIYRIGGNLTSFTRLTEIDNTTTLLLDNFADDNTEGSLATTIGDGQAPAGLSFLVEVNAVLFGAVGSKLFFTPIGQPYNWPSLNFLQYEADITGLAATANGLLVMTATRTHVVVGVTQDTIASQLLSGDQGCKAYESVVNIGSAAIWVSNEGICTSDGARVIVITRDKLGELDLDPVSSAVHEEVYYVVDRSNYILAFDFGVGQVFKQFELDVEMLTLAENKLYGWSDATMYQLFAGVEPSSFSYLSPRFIEGRATELKTYKKVYIYSKGDIIIDIFVDDKKVSSAELTEEDGHTVQIPQELQRGFFIQFALSGTGEVYEIEYVAEARKNA